MLEEFLALNVFHLVLVLMRIGALFMLLPGVSANYVSPRVRIILSIATTVVLTPMLAPLLPPLPAEAGDLVLLFILEAFYGLYMGLIGRVILGALHLAGTAIGQAGGLMNAMVFDPVTEQQGALVIGFLTNIALVLMFVMNVHHVMLEAVVASYGLFPPGSPVMAGDHLTHYVDLLAQSFYLGLQLASPFLIFGLVFQVTMGIMARMSPQMNVFFVALPMQVLLGLGLLWLSIPTLIMWFLGYLENVYAAFIPG